MNEARGEKSNVPSEARNIAALNVRERVFPLAHYHQTRNNMTD